MATQKGWKSDQRGWLFAFFITAATHAGIFLQIDSGLFAARQSVVAPLVTLSLVTIPAKAPPAVTTQAAGLPGVRPEPVAKRPVPEPRPVPVEQRRTSGPERLKKQPVPPEIPDTLQAMTNAVPPAAGPVVMAEIPVEPPHTDAAYLNNPPPGYPRILLRRGVEGTVLVRAQVQEDGRCSQVRVKESSGYEQFDEAALTAVQDWRFVPARQGVKTVVAWVDVPIAFRIDRSR
ncbi:MAG: TonB family protein [Gammaproteobacteria bacterium]